MKRLPHILVLLAALILIGLAEVLQWTGGSAQGGQRTITVGLYENAPKIYSGPNGRPAGLFIELLDEMARIENWKLRYVPCEWSDCLDLTERGELDLMPDVAFSTERALRFDFHSVSAASSWSQIYSRPQFRVYSLADLAGKRVALLQGGIQQPYFAQLMASVNFDYVPVPVKSLDEGYAAVEAGNADAVVTNSFFSARNGARYKLHESPIVFLPTNLYFATGKGRNGELLMRIDEHLTDWRRDSNSVYFSALHHAMATPQEVLLPRWALWSLAGGGAAMLLLLGVSLLLRWRVAQRTASLREANIELRESREKYRVLTESINDVIWAVDGETLRYLYVSPSITTLSGYTPAEIMAGPFEALLQADKAEEIKTVIARHLAEFQAGLKNPGHFRTDEIELTCKDGSKIWTEIVTNFYSNTQNGRVEILGVTRNINERKKAEERIRFLANFDHLTGLPNRAELQVRFQHALEQSRRSGKHLALMYLDLDHFKNINDTLGHTFGDQLLLEVAQRIRAFIREEDTVSRQGGDEFILVFPEMNEDGAARMASALIDIISQPFGIESQDLIVTPSIGIAIYPSDGEDFEVLLKNADAAMYRVKQGSHSDFRFFAQEMQAHSARTLLLSNALRHALSRNQLQLYFQPQIALRDDGVVGAEALLRWMHPELGTIPPAEFIPIAEESGQIVQIGEWVLRTAVRQQKDWLDAGLPPMVMAVNLSAAQFRHPGLPELVSGILDEVGLPHQYLELELTEAVAMDEPQSAVATMDRLHELGIRMSIDDFGTGYSSLSYLKRFKVYKLKIDQSFVRDIINDPDDKAIVTAIINMANGLGMLTIAEGVETAGQLEFLRAHGCTEVQGYYFSRPIPADQFERYLKERQ